MGTGKTKPVGRRQAAAELQAETAKLAGYPIRVIVEDEADLPDGTGVNLAWERGSAEHLVLCQREPAELQPYELAAALVRISRKSEARKAGKSRFPTVSRQQIDDLLHLSTARRLSDSRLREGSG